MKRVLCVMLLCALLCGCAREQPGRGQTLFCMNTFMDMTFWGSDADAAAEDLTAIFTELERTWSVTRGDSCLYTGNFTAEQQVLLDRAEQLRLRTGGAFDPRLRSLSTLWGFYNAQNQEPDFTLPTQTQIEQALADPRWDLGGILKGYAGELAVQALEALNIDRAILNLGGNVQTYGEKPDGTPWNIAIQSPDGGGHLGVVSVMGTMSVVTSGDYQRYFEKDGVRYHHILDPETGSPAASGLRSVTVICQNGTTADALSTALFVMGLDKGVELWRQSDDFEAVFVLADGRICATQGAALSGCEYEVIGREN